MSLKLRSPEIKTDLGTKRRVRMNRSDKLLCFETKVTSTVKRFFGACERGLWKQVIQTIIKRLKNEVGTPISIKSVFFCYLLPWLTAIYQF